VLDFGLVKVLADRDHGATLTAQGVISGTPAYMAPEQAKGADRADARSDLYAVGCVAYWLLTGRRVFEGGTPLEILMHHLQTPPIPPSGATETEVPAGLDAIVMACLEKDPERRPQSASALRALLEECGLDQDWSDDRAQRWWNSHVPQATR
jgi:serine/threonine-protein kinase